MTRDPRSRPSRDDRRRATLTLFALALLCASIGARDAAARRLPPPHLRGVPSAYAPQSPLIRAARAVGREPVVGTNFRISAGVTNGLATGNPNELGDYTGLDFVAGLMQPAWGDNSPTLPGIPDHPSPDIATARVTVPTTGAPVVGPTVNASAKPGYQAEAAVAVNPTNTQNIVVLSNDLSIADGLFKAVSMDGGATWTRGVVGTGTDGLPPACCDPTVAFDRFGNCYIGWLDSTADHAVVCISTDGGLTVQHLASLGNGDVDQPTITTGPGPTAGTAAVWVTWKDFANGAIAAAGAPVNGLGSVGAFTAPQYAPGSSEGNFGDIVVGPNGEVMVAFQDNIPTEGPSTLFVNLDPDGFGPNPFGPAIAVTRTNVGGFDSIPPQPNRTVDAEVGLAWDRSSGPFRGRLYMIYTDEPTDESGNTDLFLRFSDDFGTSWSDPIRVNDDSTTRSQFFPRIALDQSTGKVAVSWYDARADSGSGADDTDGAANTDVAVWGALITDTGTPSAPANLRALPVSNTEIRLTWEDRSANETAFHVERRQGTSGTFRQVATTGANVTSYLDTGLTPDTTYFYRVRARNAAGFSRYSPIASATTTVFSISGRVTRDGAGLEGVTVTAGPPAPITRSVSPGVAIPDDDETGITSTLTIDAPGTLAAVRVGVNISHTYIGDLEVSLVHPDGTRVVLHNLSGGSQQNLVTSYPDQTTPAESLDILQGKPLAGDWRLTVRDLAAQDVGTLNSWSLTLQAAAPGTFTTTTDATGAYRLVVPPGAYTVTPSMAGLLFEPPSRQVTVGPDATGVDFAARTPATISGRVTRGATGLPGVRVRAGTQSVLTDSGGNYTLTGLAAGTYVVSASLSGYVFEPASVKVVLDGSVSGVDFRATPVFTISGRVMQGTTPVEGATVTASRSVPGTAGDSIAPRAPIPDASARGVESTIDIPQSGSLRWVRVSVSIRHPWRGDLYVSLIHPDGTEVVLFNGPRSDSTDNLATTFPDPTRPVGDLGRLTGKPIAGGWKLRVRDLARGDTGILNAWTLTLGYTGAVVATARSRSNGTYTIRNLRAGSYTVTAFKPGLTLVPSGFTNPVTVGPSRERVNFVAQ